MYDLNPDMVTEIYDRLLDKFEKDKFYDSDFSNQEEHLNKCIEDLIKTITPEQKPILDRLCGAIQVYSYHIGRKRFGSGMRYMYDLGMCLKNKY